MTEEKLSIQIAEIYGVEVDDVDFAKSGEEQVLEKLATDSTGADEEDTGLGSVARQRSSAHWTLIA